MIFSIFINFGRKFTNKFSYTQHARVNFYANCPFAKNIYALFHMNKNECIKVDTQTMELIKLDEKKSRLVDLALTRLG